ncbi:MAG: zinc-dependent metalloprotease [bacterium]
MRNRIALLTTIVVMTLLAFSGDALAGRKVRTFGDTKPKSTSDSKKPDKDKLKPFDELIKDRVVIEGLFTFYHDTTDNSMLMAVKPEQIGPVFLCGGTRSGSEGAVYDNAAMSGSFPFFFRRVGMKLMMLEKNVRFRADTTAALYRALDRGVSDHLFASTTIKSKPQDSTGTILIDPADYFIRDAQNVGHFLGGTRKTGFSFDDKNSYFGLVKSFPENTEIDVRLHYETKKPFRATSMQNPYSMFHTYHYSLSTLPETDYVSRIGDDRVGHFLTMYQDYSELDSETPYVRYVERWHLKKKNPDARISEPVEPIVFWVENTVPPEYRDAVAEGIEFWQPAFEKIGFRNAIIAKQMPDTADWDPADVRYNTVRWVVMPGASYAVGPSRANPFTGQIYDADIRVCVDFIRHMFLNMENFISPVSHDDNFDAEELLTNPDIDIPDPRVCTYAEESAREAAFGLSYLQSAAGDLADKDSLTKEYVHAYIVELVAHEIGHTLGFRHNFKASTIYTLDQMNDREFTRQHSMTGTIMDYTAANIAGPGKVQGEFYASVPGPYDDWVIEYAYSDFGTITPEEELPRLREIAARAPEAMLVYGTDEDAFGYSAKSIDPLCNLFDMGDDPIAYCEHRINLTRELWFNSMDEFEKPGEGYQRVRRAFQYGWRPYTEATRFVPKFVGGIYHNRHHVDDPGGQIPFRPVPATEQRQAMAFLSDHIFAPDAFDLPAELLNKLQPERFPDFNWSVYSISQIDYPIHDRVLGIQNGALRMLYSPYILYRLVNNLKRYDPDEEVYTMYDMFTDLRHSIWGELDQSENINSFRRQLQLRHLNYLIAIYLSRSSSIPSDARSLAANDLDILETTAGETAGSAAIDNMTRVHLKEVQRQIASARGALRNFSDGK